MSYLTYEEIAERVKEALDIQDEEFVDAAELKRYCNDAIKKCEAKIHTIYEDYFLADASIELENGVSEYDFPEDIYANKIRAIIYKNGSTIYEIKKIKDINKFLRLQYGLAFDTSADYRYYVKNPASGKKIVLVPASREDSEENVTIHYLRRALQVVDDTDEVDIPEFYSYIVAYMRYKVYLKEGHPNTEQAMNEVLDEEKDMVETLTEMIPDGDNLVPLDLSSYEESNC